MGTKMIVLIFVCWSVTVAGGERKITGNIHWDLIHIQQDTVTASVSIVVQPAQKQDPFINGLYSLAVPGVGQYHSEHYTKAAVFFGAEVALVVYALISNNSGNTKTKAFQAYAEANWDAVRYAKWIETYGKTEYGPMNVTFTQTDYDLIRDTKDFSKINEWERGSHKLGFSHSLPKYREQQYYELIGKYHQFKFGWKDYPMDANGVPVSDAGRYDELIPQQLKDYAVERGKANDYYYAASFAVSALVINHVVSAIDAFISTKSFNNSVSASLNMRPVDGFEGKRLLSQLTINIGL